MHPAAHIQPEVVTILRLSGSLSDALRQLVRSSALHGLGPMEIARTLGVDKSMTSRLMTALRASDPLVTLSSLPGPGSLRQFVLAAGAHGASRKSVSAAQAELRTFDLELQRTFGTRTQLDAIIADSLPDARRRQQEGARQAVYRGMALIRGVSIDVASVTWIVHPCNEQPGIVEMQVLAGFGGVRRVRPTARIRLAGSYSRSQPDTAASPLREFCHPADLSITSSGEGGFTFYEISTGSVGRGASVDVFLTEFLRTDAGVAEISSPQSVFAVGGSIAHPSKRLVLNMLLHKSMWPECDFSMIAYDTAMRGLVRLPDASRDVDKLSIDSTFTRSSVSDEVLRSVPIPRYAEMLRHLSKTRGWELDDFRFFGCEVVYPPYGAQVILARV